MTASVRGVGSIFRTSDSPAAAYVIAAPSDIEAGDLLIAIICVEASSQDLEITTLPDGWQWMSNNSEGGSHTFDDVIGDGGTVDCQIWSKFHPEGGDATFVFIDAGASHHAVGAIIAIKDPGAINIFSNMGEGAAAPVPVEDRWEARGSNTNACSDLTTTEACLVLRIIATERTSGGDITDVPAGTTSIFTVENSGAVADANDVQIGASWEVQDAAGATGTAAFTVSATEESHCYTIAIGLSSLYPTQAPSPPDKRTTISYPAFRRRSRPGTL